MTDEKLFQQIYDSMVVTIRECQELSATDTRKTINVEFSVIHEDRSYVATHIIHLAYKDAAQVLCDMIIEDLENK